MMIDNSRRTTKALVLFSGGLDSILSCRVLMAQGIEVIAVKFISPFFEHFLLEDVEGYKKRVHDVYGINVHLEDISAEYISMIRHPAHGYGKHFNPCVDCKIFMVTRARQMMQEFGASFLATGEVIGQRPMSQRRDTLRVIARDSGCGGTGNKSGCEDNDILLRPLCAKNLEPTWPERQGLVDRERLYAFSGRSRAQQIRLAHEFEITDYPTPAGGCVLTDPVVGERIKRFYAVHQTVTVSDMGLITLGRHFFLPSGGWLIVGRKEQENDEIAARAEADDVLLKLQDRPGPTALLRFTQNENDAHLAAAVVARYGKKDTDGCPQAGSVAYWGACKGVVRAEPIAPDELQKWTDMVPR